MDDSGSHFVVPTLISLWSAMLGGAIGGATGKISPVLLCSGGLGLFVGAAASVLVHMFMYTILYVVTDTIFKAELDSRTIGGYKSDTLASVLGGITGICSASIVSLALPSKNLAAAETFSVCWTAAAFVPLALVLILHWYTKRA